MPDALAPADIEAAVVGLLDAGMTSDVATEVPNPRPTDQRYVRVRVTGGNPANLIQSLPRVLVEVWAPDETTAFNDAQKAWALLWAAQHSFVDTVWVADVESSLPVNFPDPDTESPRYQFVTQIRASLQKVSV
ncbi:MAG TPA: hypothetical protein VGM94_09515 [Galbitalea sp.]|jgi:hypothetical protein